MLARVGIHLLVMMALISSSGCRNAREIYFGDDDWASYYRDVATEIEYPNVNQAAEEDDFALPPRSLWNHEPAEYWDLSLEEAVQLALANNRVMRDLRGRVVQFPEQTSTVYDPAIQETDPRYGIQGALSKFDAQWSTSTFWERNDRALNNIIFGGGTRLFQQDLGVFRSELSKQSATGTQFALRQNVDYDFNTAPANMFPSAWNANYEVEVRQPFGQGGGVEFNRIAGPGAVPGLLFQNGVMLARVDNDITLADFETGVRNLVNDVENAYWELYLAYRELNARIAARDSALETWRRVKRLGERGEHGGEAANEAQAAAQYFHFRAQVEDALSGVAVRDVVTGTGSRRGAVRGGGGVYGAEANLRLLLGLPTNDERLIRPKTEATVARVVFDWPQMVAEALDRRVEIRQQRWRIKRSELELIASRNFTLPTIDGVGRYRWRGFGDDLIGYDKGNGPFDNAYENLFDGHFQEWSLGFEVNVPIGQRAGHAAVRQAQFKLARTRAVLEEQERNIIHDLADAVRELHRAYDVSRTNFNVYLRMQDRIAAVKRELDAGLATSDKLLEAEKEAADAEVAYFHSVVEYNMAIKAIHFEKGSLLDYNQVYLTEGRWPGLAYRDANRRARQRAAALPINYGLTVPPPVSRGEYPQHMDSTPDAPWAGNRNLEDIEPPASDSPQSDAMERLPQPPERLLRPMSQMNRLQPVEPVVHPADAAIRQPVVRRAPMVSAPVSSSPLAARGNDPLVNPLRSSSIDRHATASFNIRRMSYFDRVRLGGEDAAIDESNQPGGPTRLQPNVSMRPHAGAGPGERGARYIRNSPAP